MVDHIGHEFDDGSKVELRLTGTLDSWYGKRLCLYKLSDKDGNVLCEGEDFALSPLHTRMEEAFDDFVAFVRRDGERFYYGLPDSEDDELLFHVDLGVWAGEHYDELSILVAGE